MAPDAFNHKFFERYGIRSIPRFLLVDPQGNVVISKARRPSDPVLKQQLTELLDAYDASKTVISGRIKDAESWMSLSKPGGWTVQMASGCCYGPCLYDAGLDRNVGILCSEPRHDILLLVAYAWSTGRI